ncbi:MAG TPA: ATP-binding protein [Flavobacterium sp.]|uniref:ATP-binding protein n=1 Tax=unclassified Flavobacterium TaxID=196869 RepID=UPI000E8A9FC4|nr:MULTISPECIES: ATP-binding protein [unclassified Flavobacterium]HBI00280.1 hybrid sensor histidine kinase/response regulator [Flavobacterium sp.]HRE79215.1 ATP-binding protein [Flavobacterium sp.]
MKYFTLVFLILTITVNSQTKSSSDDEEELDSTNYFIELANFHKKNNNYRSSQDYIQKAIEFAEEKKDYQAQADAYSFLGNVYFELKKYADAIQTYNKSISLYNNQKPSSNQAYTFYNLGLCYIERKEYSKAEYYFKEAEKIYETIDIPEAKEMINLQKGIVYRAKGENQLALSILNTVIVNPDEEDHFKTKAEALYQIGLIEAEDNRYNLALNYLNKALDLSSKNKNLELKANVARTLSEVYEKMIDVDNSFKYMKQHLRIRDSIQELNSKRIGTEDFLSFKEAERLKSIDQMDRENKEQQRANKFSKLISILSIALISILSLLSLSLYKNNIIRSQSNKLLQDKNSELQLAKDKAEKASKARAEFLSTVSHELRTPLNAINGITHLLIEENPKKSQLQYLTSLKFSGDYLLTFINDILEINRVESENIEIESINVNVKQLLSDLYNSFKDLASKNNNDFELELDESIPDNLIGDPTKLSQIFINLINNALKFTKNGKVNVSAKMLKNENDISSIRFEISDTGIGIPLEKQQTIFESFSQGSVEINRKYGGTGLGLAIVKRLVNLLGGEIKLTSAEGIGSTFSFDVDFELGQQTFVEVKKQYDESVFAFKKVLVVEDNKINQMITKKMLENKEIACELIDNGEDAIEMIRNNGYDLVLMDVHLPGINGTIATERIREFNKKLPIIALTAISLNENREMLLSFGMNDVVTKPFNPDNFYKVIAQQLG